MRRGCIRTTYAEVQLRGARGLERKGEGTQRIREEGGRNTEE